MGSKCGGPKNKYEAKKKEIEKPKSDDNEKMAETLKSIGLFKTAIADNWLQLLKLSGVAESKDTNINTVFWTVMMKISYDNPDAKDLSKLIIFEADPFVIKTTDSRIKYNAELLKSLQNFIQFSKENKAKSEKMLEQVMKISDDVNQNKEEYKKLNADDIEVLKKEIESYNQLLSQTEEQVPKLIFRFKLQGTQAKLYEAAVKSRDNLERPTAIWAELIHFFETNQDNEMMIKVNSPENEPRSDSNFMAPSAPERPSLEQAGPEQPKIEKSISCNPPLNRDNLSPKYIDKTFSIPQKPGVLAEDILKKNIVGSTPSHALIYITNYIALNSWNLVRSERLMSTSYSFSFNITTMVDIPELSMICFGTEEGKIYYVDYCGENENECLSIKLCSIPQTSSITAMCYLLNGNTLITGCNDGKIMINDLNQGTSRQLFEISSAAHCIQYAVNGYNLFIADSSKIVNFNFRNEKVVNQYQGEKEEIKVMIYSFQTSNLLVGRINSLEILHFDSINNEIAACIKKFKFEGEIVRDIIQFTKSSYFCLMENTTTEACCLYVYNCNRQELEKENVQVLPRSRKTLYCYDKKSIVNITEDLSFRLLNVNEKKTKDFSAGVSGVFTAAVVFNKDGQSKFAFGGKGSIDIWNCKAKK